MRTTNIIADCAFLVGEIDERLYGSFLEHMGRVIYSGIYEPEHPSADEQGFRQDVIEAVKQLGITQIRYPGGNFVSCYHWEDGVGPREMRPKRPELAWKAVETNEFGTNEFMQWLDTVGAAPMLAVNLGTRGIEDAVQYLEYCNFPGGTKYSDLRRSHGREKPYGVKTWCLGNEMDGSWQVGHKTAYEYGRLAAETGKAMKVLDPELELVACGSSLSSMDSFPEWEETVLEQAYETVDYISLHQYFGGQDKGTDAFLDQADEMDRYIKTVAAACDLVKAKKRSNKTIHISFDEWGVWGQSPQDTVRECTNNSWRIAPPLSEMIYTLEDALLFGGMLLALLKNADRVKMACQSLLVNVSAPIITTKGRGLWLQPIFYPFAQVSKYGRGQVMELRGSSPAESRADMVAVCRREEGEIVLFAINRDSKEKNTIHFQLNGLKCTKIKEHMVLTSQNPKATNQENPENVIPRPEGCSSVLNDGVSAVLETLSWNMIRIAIERLR